MSKIVFIMPAIRPPKCKDCKWSAKLHEEVLICTTFKVKPDSKMYEFKDDVTYCIDTEIARRNDKFCGYYGTQFEPK
jgi:hypothetical protein